MFFDSYKNLITISVITGQKVEFIYEDKPTLNQVRGRIYRDQGGLKMTWYDKENVKREKLPGMESEEDERETIFKISEAKFNDLLATADPPLRKQLLIARLLDKINTRDFRAARKSRNTNTADSQPVSIATEAVFTEF